MAPLLRPRLTCFYCGRGSAHKKTQALRKWQCESCDAENFLDENGDITDPPPSQTNENAQYGLSINRPTSPIFDTAPDSIFCATCLKNQHLYTESLAQYYPSPTAENFRDYERALPVYKEKLEERYPQCCESCEPRARQRLRDANYAAKTDNLRRIMERTRSHTRPLNQKGRLLGLLFSLAGISWALSWTGQILWSVITLLVVDPNSWGGKYATNFFEPAKHKNHSLVVSELDNVFLQTAGYTLLLAAASIWWNPMLKKRLSRRGGRIVGISEYYRLQLLSLAVRAGAWYWIFQSNPNIESQRAIHSFMLIFSGPVVFRSLNVVSIDNTLNIAWGESPKSLLSKPSRQKSPLSIESPTPQIGHLPRPKHFPIGSLAPQPLQPYRPPTPPESHVEYEPDPMDWSAVKTSLPVSQVQKENSGLPSMLASPLPVPRAGFRGNLPPNIISPAHRLRNPPNQPIFRKASEAKKQSFFSGPNGRNPDYETQENIFKDPTLFPSDGKDETGLESILERAFTISEPTEVREGRQTTALTSQQSNFPLFLRTLFPLLTLATSYAILYTTPPQPISRLLSYFPPTQLQYFALGLPAILAIRSATSTSSNDLSNVLVSGIQCVAVGVLYTAVRRQLNYDEQALELIGKCAIGVSGILNMMGRIRGHVASEVIAVGDGMG